MNQHQNIHPVTPHSWSSNQTKLTYDDRSQHSGYLEEISTGKGREGPFLDAENILYFNQGGGHMGVCVGKRIVHLRIVHSLHCTHQ